MNENSARWRWAVALLFAPVLVLATQDNPLFTPPGKLDPWLYLGFFRDLVEYKRNLFPGTYYGSRLPFLLPGAALHALFGAVTAGALFHLLIHSVATLSLFFAAKAVAGRRAAAMTALLFSVHPWVWSSTGWDNPDGGAMAYFTLSLALALNAGRARKPLWMLAGAGVAAAAAVYTNLFLTMFVVFLPFHTIDLRSERPFRAAAASTAWMLTGAVALTAALSAVNRWIEGTWNFYAPSIQFAREKGNTTSNPIGVWSADGLAPWLWFGAAAAVATVLLLPGRWQDARKGRPAALFLMVHFLACGGIMCYLQATGPTVLGLNYYASYLLPLTFLVISLSFWQAADSLSPLWFVVALGAAAIASLFIWSDRSGTMLPPWPAGRYAVTAALAAFLGSAILFRRRRAGFAAALAGLMLLNGYVRIRMPDDPHAWRRDYAVLASALDRISQARGGRPVLFLADENGREDDGYSALDSTYLHEFSVIGRALPKDACRRIPVPQGIVVVASRRAEAAGIAASTFTSCWKGDGLIPQPAGVVPVPLTSTPFTATLFRAVPDPARWQPFPAPLPLNRWKVWVHPSDHGTFRQVNGGLWALTPRGTDYAFTYAPIMAPAEGRYRFTLRYTPIEGSIAFGAYRPEDLTWRVAAQTGTPVHNDRELSFLVDLRAGERVDLLISQNGTPGPRRASLVMRELTAGVLTSAPSR